MKEMNKKEEAGLRFDIMNILSESVEGSYVGDILDTKNISEEAFIDAIVSDVLETSGWEDEGVYTESDIRFSIGRKMLERLENAEVLCNLYNVVGVDDLKGITFARCTTYEKAEKAMEIIESNGFNGMITIEQDELPVDTVKIEDEVIKL